MTSAPPLLDTHQHLILRDRIGYAWSDALPPLAGRDFTVADYQTLVAGKGVAASIFMETGVDDGDYRAEARLVADLMRDPAARIVGLIASCRPEDDEGFDAWLEECATLPVVGFRRILHEIDDDLSRSEGFRRNLRKFGARDLTFDMCFRADQLPIAAALAAACDEQRLILDHCGVPDIAGGGFDPWRRDIAALARHSHVSCKLSGVFAYCAPGEATAATVRPYIEHALDCFGADRLVWGGDWPVVDLRSGLPDWIDGFRELIGELSDNEARRICSGTAERIYGVALPPA